MGLRGVGEPYRQLITNLRIGLELPVVRTTSVTADKSTMFVFHWILVGYVWISYTP